MDRRPSTFQQINNEIKSFFMHSKVNFVLTSFVIIVATYVSLTVIIGRNIVHPLSSTTEKTPRNVDELIHSIISIFFLLVISLATGKLFQQFSLPPLFGALLVGIICQNIPALKPLFYVDPHWEYCLRTIALANIVVRWGIGLDAEALMINPILPLMLGLLSSTAEVISIILAAVFLFDISVSMAILCGFILTATSPAVTVPVMLDLQNRNLGTEKGIPTTILAASTIDNMYCITAFMATASIVFSPESLLTTIWTTAAQLVIGAFYGVLIGWLLWWFPSPDSPYCHLSRTLLLASLTTSTITGSSVLGYPSAGIISAILICFIAAIKWKENNQKKTFPQERAFAHLWNIIFMPLLFSLIGMKFDMAMMTWTTVFFSCALIVIGVLIRFLSGIILSLCSGFTIREQFVIALSLVPKATVQAALGPSIIVMCEGFPQFSKEAEMVVTTCILTILITAPLGQYVLTMIAARTFTDNRAAQKVEFYTGSTFFEASKNGTGAVQKENPFAISMNANNSCQRF